jgi:type III secretion system YscD/HrpQ family protein
MTGYLVCEDGPLAEWIFTFDEVNHWMIGRDGDLCTFVLEDPMVSRKHLSIFYEDDIYYAQNESSTNPALLNDKALEEKTELSEDDLIQIGNNIFRFTTSLPNKEEQGSTAPIPPKEIEPALTLGHFPTDTESESKCLIKVINGPGAGASFPLSPSSTYVIGSDSSTADILLHDLSISKSHARITLSENGETSIIDLESKNGVFVDGKKIDSDKILNPEDLIILGTTSLLFINMDQTRDTIYSPGAEYSLHPEKSIFSEDEQEEESKDWKETFIPTKHLAVASVFSIFICVGIISLLALFRSGNVENLLVDETADIRSAISHFGEVEFNYNKDSATLFLTGHVLTDVDYSELLYRLRNIPYITNTDDNVVIDELVSENINALILKNPAWNSVLVTAREPGRYLLTGYIQSEKERAELTDFMNKYFTYLNLLHNQIVVEDTLVAHINTILLENGFANVVVEQNMGQIILSGRAHEKERGSYEAVLSKINTVHGVRVLNNFVIFTTANTASIDLSSKYKVTGSSKFGNKNQFVLIGGKILGVDDTLDGMIISKILGKEILLHKEGVKYKIDFND